METRSTLDGRRDRLHRFAGRALAALDSLMDAPAWAMTPEEQAETLVELGQVLSRVTELQWRVLAAADRNDIGGKDGSTSTAAWLADHTRENRSQSHGDLRAARTLDEARFTVTREAFAAGRLTRDQVWVIIRAVEDLPAEVTEEQRVEAQECLVALAADHDAGRLRLLSKRVFEMLAPEEADRREAEALEREERQAWQRCRFAMRDNGDGTNSGWFKLPTLHAQMLNKAVQALAAPRRTDPSAWVDGAGRRAPYPVLLGHAFADLVEHLPLDHLPQAGGTAASVVITVELEKLREKLGSAALDTGGQVSPSECRRIACNSGIIPAVLGSTSVPLDLGRKVRLHTASQRTAMAIRDKGCTTEGCDRPPAWTEAHHEVAWSLGGGTSVNDGRLLCPFHHRLAHDEHYDMRRRPDGKVRFHKRT